jgi:hypothetical protein
MHLDEIDRRGFVGAVALGALGVARVDRVTGTPCR